MSTASSSGPDLAAVTRRQQKIWSQGDFAAIGSLHQIVSELLCEAVDLHAGQQVLDVACGSGNTAIAATRRFCEVTGLDFVPTLLDRARARADAEGLPVTFEEGDASRLPFADATFDAVLSTFGCMFAPDQARTAAEMARVCRPGGKIGMASWTPDSLPGTVFRIVAGYIPPAPGLQPPTRWGTEAGLRDVFGDTISELRIERRDFIMRYRSANHWLDYFRENFGPLVSAFAALDADGQQRLADELLASVAAINTATDGTLVAPAEYLEVVIMRR